MCGICGIYSKSEIRKNSIILSMCEAIKSRGPDDSGYFNDEKVSLGMRRLSIIDLQTGTQPIYNENKSIVIVFNGEIYNYMELRNLLIQKKHTFSTNTDTEVLVHLYEEYGEKMLSHLNGMFAFAIYDIKRKSLFLARDRLGIKPLYYYKDNEKLVFGSEIKAILEAGINKEINIEALHSFFSLEYIPSPMTIFRGIMKLEPGYFIMIKEGNLTKKKYWDLKYNPNHHSKKYFVNALRELLYDSVRIRMVADVPLGAFLSGGIDSSLIVSQMSKISSQPIKTFSIGFKDQTYNELHSARLIAKKFKTIHSEIILEPDILDLVNKTTSYLDEPFSDTSTIPTYLLSQATRNKVTVALSGDGADEIFAGYDRFLASKIQNFYSKIPSGIKRKIYEMSKNLKPSLQKKGFINKTKRFLQGDALPINGHHMRWQYFSSYEEDRMFFADSLHDQMQNFDSLALIDNYYTAFGADDRLANEQYADVKTYLTDAMLVKVDRMSMANSLEVRVPFLDHRLVEFAFTIPSNLKLNGFTTKYILKEAAKGILPDEIINKPKEGFSIPVKNWIRNELKDYTHKLLLSNTEATSYFKKNYIEKILMEHDNRKDDHSHRIWALVNFINWHNTYMEK